MSAVYTAVTPTSLLMMSVCALGWVLAFATLVLARRRGRRLRSRHQRQLDELSSVAACHERKSEQYGTLLKQTQRKLSGLSERHVELTMRLEAMQRASATRQTAIAVPHHDHHSRPSAVDQDTAARLRELQDTLVEMRRGRELAEQRAEKLRVANQVEMRKIAGMTAELDDATHAMEDARGALMDNERRLTEVQGQLGAALAQVQLQAKDREHLELQNLELKRMLDQLGQWQIAAPLAPVPPAADEKTLGKCSPGVVQDWERVTESDIRDVIVAIAEQTQEPAPAQTPAALGVAANSGGSMEQEELQALRRQVCELAAENLALRNANSGTYPVARPIHNLTSESRDLVVTPLDAAVLSDSLGLPIAGKGSVSSESLAAVSGLALSNAERVRELLPVGPITSVQWVDQYGKAVTCKLLRLAGDEMAMTTLGVGTPSEETLRETLKSILSSIGWNEKGPLEDESKTATG